MTFEILNLRTYKVKVLAGFFFFYLGIKTLFIVYLQIADEWVLSDFKQIITIAYIILGLFLSIYGFILLKLGSKEWYKEEELDISIKYRTRGKLELEIEKLKGEKNKKIKK